MKKMIKAVMDRLGLGDSNQPAHYNLLFKDALHAKPVAPRAGAAASSEAGKNEQGKRRLDPRDIELPMTRLLVSGTGPRPEERKAIRRAAETSLAIHLGVVFSVVFFLIVIPLINPERLTELVLTLNGPPPLDEKVFPDAGFRDDLVVNPSELVKEAGSPNGMKEPKSGGGGGGGGSHPEIPPTSHDYGDAKGFVPMPSKLDIPEIEPDAPILPTGMAVPPPPNIANLMPSAKLTDGPIVPDSEKERIGGGTGGGVGSGRGNGYGPGSGGGWGGGTGGGHGSGNGNGIGNGDGGGMGVARYGEPGVQMPVCIFKPTPKFTDEAIQRRVSGIVTLQGVVRENGRVDSLRILRGLGYGLDQNAVDTVMAKWKFKPGLRNGRPTAVMVNIEVVFQLY